MADFNKLMELVTDFGVESLRVGSYEARIPYGASRIRASDLRERREQARERVAKALREVCNPSGVTPTVQPQPKEPK